MAPEETIDTDSEDDEAEVRSLMRVATFGRFHDVARRHKRLMDDVLQTIPPEPPHPRFEEGPERDAWDLWDHEAAKIRAEADEHATITIVFAAAACELYINDLAARRLGDKYFRKHLDRMEVLNKWVIVPRLVSGYQIDKGGRAFQLLALLVSARNELMHPKSQRFSWEQLERDAKHPPKSRIEFAPDAIEALDRLGEETEKFDPDVPGLGLFDAHEHLERQLKRGK